MDTARPGAAGREPADASAARPAGGGLRFALTIGA